MQPTLPASSSVAPRRRARSPTLLVVSFLAIFGLAAAIYHAPARLAELDRATERSAAARMQHERSMALINVSKVRTRAIERARKAAARARQVRSC